MDEHRQHFLRSQTGLTADVYRALISSERNNAFVNARIHFFKPYIRVFILAPV